MKSILKTVVLIFVFSLSGSLISFSQNQGIKLARMSSFRMQSSAIIAEDGSTISLPGYNSNIYWFPVVVPSTVLSGLVANKVYPDPYTGLNNMLIPDASDEFNKRYNLEQFSFIPGVPNPWKKPYWYRTVFEVSATDKGRHFELLFKGINYRASVWLNGKQITDSTQMAGMFAEYRLDVTDAINPGSANAIAVKIYPLDYPGLPDTEQLKALGDFFLNGGPTGDIGKNVTMLCSVGWDWIPPVRDRNIGIWQPVYLKTSGPVTIEQPKIVTGLPHLPDTSSATVSISLKLFNHRSSSEKGILKIKIAPQTFTGNSILINKEVLLPGDKSFLINIGPDEFKELILKSPHLWWPNGYGNPDLYKVNIQLILGNNLSDEISILTGIREVGSDAVDVNGTIRRNFYVNGRRIHITGGAWVPDMMLNRDSLRYDYEFRLCRNSNINLVRIWGGGVTPSDYFFDAADRYGLLVWSDFWITGDTQGEFKGSPEWPVEGEVFKKNVASTIYRIRNHPSLQVWTGGNEGHARKELYDAMRDSVMILDGTRPFIPSSSGFAKLPEGWPGAFPDGKAAGVYSGGPYTWQDPKDYYTRADAGKDWVFKDETGIPSQPPFSILPKIIPDLIWDRSLPFPLNNTWGYHDAATGNGHYERYYQEMVKRYGEPRSIQEFSDKMQLMNSVGYQGIFEAAGHKLNETGGVMLWKLNAAFPSVMWQVYDWYLCPNAGYYFMQNACEPIHIQLNTKDQNVEALNRSYNTVSGLMAMIDIYNIDSRAVFHNTQVVNLPPTEVVNLVSLAANLTGRQGVSLIFLKLTDKTGKSVSRNVYWLSGDNDFKSLNNMPVAVVEAKQIKYSSSDTEMKWTINFTNSSDRIAFFLHAQILADKEEVLPSFWSTNYFSLGPDESFAVTVSCPGEKCRNKKLQLSIDGWNSGNYIFDLVTAK